MSDLILYNKYARTTELKGNDVHPTDSCVRLYFEHRPDTYNLQVRTFGKLGDNKNTKDRNFISTIPLSGDEILMLAEYVRQTRNDSK